LRAAAQSIILQTSEVRVSKRTLIVVLLALAAVGTAVAGSLSDVKIVFCRQVEDREPVQPGVKFPADAGWVYCHTTLGNGGEATQIFHDWYFQGSLVGRFTLPVGASQNWRTYSARPISSAWVGKWKVVVKAADEKELGHGSFEVTAAAE
jgi:hypothetical protein